MKKISTENKENIENRISTEDIDRILSEKQEEVNRERSRYIWKTVIIVTVVFLAFVILVKVLFPLSLIDGKSMYPTYDDNQLVLGVNMCVDGNIKNGDVIAFSNEKTHNVYFVKRIEGMPGDTIVIRDGILYRNGEEIDEGFDVMEEAGRFSEEYTLGEDEYFVIGDNRNHSYDGRFIGPISKKDIWCRLINSNNQSN